MVQLEILHLKTVRAAHLTTLDKKRLMIGISIISDPKLILFEEPSKGLCPESSLKIWRLIRNLAGRFSVLVSTTCFKEASVLSDRIAVIQDGVMRSISTESRFKML
jgi:ABC-type multidrug transport system ATPase subunit